MPLVPKPNSPFYWYDFRYAGRRYRGSTKETTKAAARAFEAEMLTNLERKRPQHTRGRRAPLLRDFFVSFEEFVTEDQSLAGSTKRYYLRGVAMLKKTPLAEFQLDQIKDSAVRRIEFPKSGSNANNGIRTLSRLLSYAAEQEIIQSSPRLSLRQEIERDTTFTPDQELRMLAVAPQPLSDVFVLCMDLGTRPEEVFRIRWDDVLWEQNLLQIQHGKTKASRRTIGMSSRVREVLQTRRKAQAAEETLSTSPWVFPSRRKKAGEITHITTVNKAFVKARRAAGLPSHLVLYSSRHTFGTDVMAGSKNPKLIMVSMGHVDARVSARYQHPGTEQIGAIIDARNAQRKTVTTKLGHSFGHSHVLNNAETRVNTGADERT